MAGFKLGLRQSKQSETSRPRMALLLMASSVLKRGKLFQTKICKGYPRLSRARRAGPWRWFSEHLSNQDLMLDLLMACLDLRQTHKSEATRPRCLLLWM